MLNTDSPGQPVQGARLGHPMAEPTAKRRFDPLTAAAVVFFLMAVAFAAAPAINAGPATLAGLMLLIGLAGVACLGLFALRGSVEAAAEAEPGVDKLVEALSEPAAIAAADGRIQAANKAWREILGAATRLPKGGPSAANLFSALTAARRGLTAQASIRSHGAEHNATISPLGARRYLVRLAAGPAEPLALPSDLSYELFV